MPVDALKLCRWLDLGLVPYQEATALQERLAQDRLDGAIPDTLVLLEHPPVITVGRAGGLENLLADPATLAQRGISLHFSDRGGNVTYHGPGQLVGYPILDLTQHGKDVLLYVRLLERTIISALAEFGIESGTRAGYPGVWVGQRKIAALGVHVRRWVTKHGFALNVQPDLAHFQLIHPCGIKELGVTSMAEVLGRDLGIADVRRVVVEAFATTFGFRMAWVPPAQVVGTSAGAAA